mgnify:CR=1 FL=1
MHCPTANSSQLVEGFRSIKFFLFIRFFPSFFVFSLICFTIIKNIFDIIFTILQVARTYYNAVSKAEIEFDPQINGYHTEVWRIEILSMCCLLTYNDIYHSLVLHWWFDSRCLYFTATQLAIQLKFVWQTSCQVCKKNESTNC